MGQPGSGVIGGKHSEAEAKYSSSSLEWCPAANRNDCTEKDPDRHFGEHIPQIGGIKIEKPDDDPHSQSGPEHDSRPDHAPDPESRFFCPFGAHSCPLLPG